MTPEQRQILINQIEIMKVLRGDNWNDFSLRLQETSDLLNPTKDKEAVEDLKLEEKRE